MKKSLFLLVLAMIVAACTQQVPYASLWEEANQAISQDLPRTALECLEKIEQKAEAEGNETQLLKMWMARCNCLEQISVEEAMQAVGEMDSLLAKKQTSDLKALWHTALAELYEQMSGYSVSLLKDNTLKAKSHWQAAFEDAEKLAEVPATRYEELLTVDNTDKKCGSNDVLMFVYLEYIRKSHVPISDRLAMADRVAAVYEKQGNRPAQLSALLEKTSCLQFTEKLTWQRITRIFRSTWRPISCGRRQLATCATQRKNIMTVWPMWWRKKDGASTRQKSGQQNWKRQCAI